ncbi:rCG30232 [Rattus norvegicus]|uniref:RCG30232 n=1 Tax=Rattus norvegicus TaxID=10116 RepID=A6ILV4_RAT|nr:rCG30232 [Rattus norvegicus]
MLHQTPVSLHSWSSNPGCTHRGGAKSSPKTECSLRMPWKVWSTQAQDSDNRAFPSVKQVNCLALSKGVCEVPGDKLRERRPLEWTPSLISLQVFLL